MNIYRHKPNSIGAPSLSPPRACTANLHLGPPQHQHLILGLGRLHVHLGCGQFHLRLGPGQLHLLWSNLSTMITSVALRFMESNIRCFSTLDLYSGVWERQRKLGRKRLCPRFQLSRTSPGRTLSRGGKGACQALGVLSNVKAK